MPPLIFSPGSIEKLPRLIAGYGQHCLLITGKSSLQNSDYGRGVLKQLTQVAQNTVIISAEPSPDDIDTVVNDFFYKNIDVVVAIGGGSVLDSGKAVSAMLPLGEPVANYLEGVGGKKHPGSKVPFIAVPTTSGTGSEATKNAVISRVGEKGFKRSLRHDRFIPDLAILDPNLMLSCPPEITVSSGMDSLTQLIEAYVSTGSNRLTDALAYSAIDMMLLNLEEAVNDGNNLKARSALAYSAFISGVVLANAGLGVVHGLASSVGSRVEVPHGMLCATLMAPTHRVNIEKLIDTGEYTPALEKYAKLGRLFAGHGNATTAAEALNFADGLHRLTLSFPVKKLGYYGFTTEMAESTVKLTSQKNNPVTLSEKELKWILEQRI